jgi:Rps23 Pro-64 3,4-dihydroxylase Tpa1-like proline 4-hydroxylase
MIIKQMKSPFPYLIVDDYYDTAEVEAIWQEIYFLSYPHKFVDGSNSNKEKERDGVSVKHNKCIYLDNVYADRNISNILSINRKLFDKNITQSFSELCFGYDYFAKCNLDYTTLSYYDDGDYYLPHDDFSLYTSITWFYEEPKRFENGNLIFSDYSHDVEVKNNRMVMFPSHVRHHVDKLIGQGRFAISQFVSRNLVR